MLDLRCWGERKFGTLKRIGSVLGLKPCEKIWFEMRRCIEEEIGFGFGESERG